MAEIKGAYRRLARKYHPDVSEERDAEARFKEVNEAYCALKDAGRRAADRERLRRIAARDRETERRIAVAARYVVRTRHVEVERGRRAIGEPTCDECGAPARARATCACAWPRS